MNYNWENFNVQKGCKEFRKGRIWKTKRERRRDEEGLGSFSSDSSGELDVLWHDGDSLGVDGAQVGVFEEADEVGLGSFLEDHVNYLLMYQKITWRAPIAADWNRRSVLKSWAISRTSRWNGSFRIRSSVDFWYRRISRRATVPGRYRWGFLTPPVDGADFRAA